MNQVNLYESLNRAGCKILSFEDFPSSYGSWRVTFILLGFNCEVVCNRADNLLSFTSTNQINGKKSITIPTQKLVSDQLEIAKVIEYLRTLKVNQLLNSNYTYLAGKERANNVNAYT